MRYMWYTDLRRFDAGKKGKKNTINALKYFISSENALHASASLACFVLFFTSTTMYLFCVCLQRYDIYKYMKAQVRWLNYRINTPRSHSCVSLSERLRILNSVTNHQTNSHLQICDGHDPWALKAFISLLHGCLTRKIYFKPEQHLLPLVFTYRRKTGCCYWCCSKIYIDGLK